MLISGKMWTAHTGPVFSLPPRRSEQSDCQKRCMNDHGAGVVCSFDAGGDSEMSCSIQISVKELTSSAALVDITIDKDCSLSLFCSNSDTLDDVALASTQDSGDGIQYAIK